MNVDGMKTGFTSGAGYSLVTSATNGNMRLISAVMGANSMKSRESDSKQLLSYGFRFFDTVAPHKQGETIENARVWMGERDDLAIGVAQTTYLTVNKGEMSQLSGLIELDRDLKAPIQQGDVVGKVIYQIGQRKVGEAPLVALESVEKGSWFKQSMDWIKRFIAGLFS
nr:hypothetical protein [Vibrio furnissii]